MDPQGADTTALADAECTAILAALSLLARFDVRHRRSPVPSLTDPPLTDDPSANRSLAAPPDEDEVQELRHKLRCLLDSSASVVADRDRTVVPLPSPLVANIIAAADSTTSVPSSQMDPSVEGETHRLSKRMAMMMLKSARIAAGRNALPVAQGSRGAVARESSQSVASAAGRASRQTAGTSRRNSDPEIPMQLRLPVEAVVDRPRSDSTPPNPPIAAPPRQHPAQPSARRLAATSGPSAGTAVGNGGDDLSFYDTSMMSTSVPPDLTEDGAAASRSPRSTSPAGFHQVGSGASMDATVDADALVRKHLVKSLTVALELCITATRRALVAEQRLAAMAPQNETVAAVAATTPVGTPRRRGFVPPLDPITVSAPEQSLEAAVMRSPVGRRRTLQPGDAAGPMTPSNRGGDKFLNSSSSAAVTAGMAGSPRCSGAYSPLYRGVIELIPVSSAVMRTASTVDIRHSTSETRSAAYHPAASTNNHASLNQDEIGTPLLNQYLLLSDLGSGSQGRVMLGFDTHTNQTRAIKIIPRPQLNAASLVRRRDGVRQWSQLQREIAIMKRCRHKNVVALYEVIDDPDADSMYLVMQYVEKGPIGKQGPDGSAPPVAPRLLAKFARQLTAGLTYLHKHGVIHRDIKPENILVAADGETAFLSDFGVSSFDDTNRTSAEHRLAEALSSGGNLSTSESSVAGSPRAGHTAASAPQRGTIAFLAPEMMRVDSMSDVRSPTTSSGAAGSGPTGGGGATLNKGEPIDVWALGMTLYVLLYGKLPWELSSMHHFMQCIVAAPIEYPASLPTATGANTEVRGEQPETPLLIVTEEEATGIDGGGSGGSFLFHREWRALLQGMLCRDDAARLTAAQCYAAARALDELYDSRKHQQQAFDKSCIGMAIALTDREVDEATAAVHRR